MKITSVECYKGNGAIGGYVTVKVNTDEGISGWGEAGLAYGNCTDAAWGQCQDFAKMVIGMDPFNTEEIWEHLHRHTFWGMGGGVVVTSGMAAIDTACWDIKGKALKLPVYQLLGGKTNKKLRAYASQLQFGWRKDIEAHDGLCALSTPEEYYNVVKEAMSEGYDAVKIDPMMVAPPDVQQSFVEMARTQDILGWLGANKQPGQFLCGFSMETENMLENSRAKLEKKHVDMIVANNLRQPGAGFAGDTNVVTMITADGDAALPQLTKDETAHRILDRILELRNRDAR